MTAMNDTLNVTREPPKPRSHSRPYWEGTREKKLLMQYCRRTGRYQFFPRPTSIYTGRRDLEWREVSGRGKVFTYTVTRRARDPLKGHEPFLIAVVTLDDANVNVMANVVRCTLEEMRIGLPMKPYWMPLPNGTHLLMFEPDRAAAGA
ncbi:MAG: Zn-ribbon domain-containing OB-fold protein [Bradyrhizobiaceae bacterium]|nr:Zn-ribbon domain-containing OB-fold protein [Bradyrhizobiaceae bacterium]